MAESLVVSGNSGRVRRRKVNENCEVHRKPLLAVTPGTVLDALAKARRAPLVLERLAASSGVHVRTVERHIERLESFGVRVATVKLAPGSCRTGRMLAVYCSPEGGAA